MNIFVIILILILLVYVGLEVKPFLFRKKAIMSFKESMNAAELPVITFKYKNKSLNFMLDSGSNASYIDAKVLKSLNVKTKKTNPTSIISGGSSVEVSSEIVLPIEALGIVFYPTLTVMNLSEQFALIKDMSQIEIHGILGNEMLGDNNFVLDFKDCIAYLK